MRGQVKATEDGQQEAQWVIGKLQDLIKNGGFQPRDCAILFRRHMQARLFEQAMVRLLYFYHQGHLLRQTQTQVLSCHLLLHQKPTAARCDCLGLAYAICLPPGLLMFAHCSC